MTDYRDLKFKIPEFNDPNLGPISFSFDISNLHARLEVAEDWAKIIIAHIHIDHIVTSALDKALLEPSAYLKKNRSFVDKLALARSLKLFDEQIYPVVTKLNSLRNNFAHDLVFEVAADERRDLMRELTKFISEQGREVYEALSFDDFLVSIVVTMDINRSYTDKIRENNVLLAKMKDELIDSSRILGKSEAFLSRLKSDGNMK